MGNTIGETSRTGTVNEGLAKVVDMGCQALAKCKWADAVHLFREALERGPYSVEIEDKLGFALSCAKQYDHAIDIYRGLCERQPNVAKWPYMVGYQYYARKEWQKAIEWFDRALLLVPNYVKVLYRKGYAHLALAQNEQGLRALESCIRNWYRAPEDRKKLDRSTFGKANFQIGKIYLGQGMSLKARRFLEIAVQTNAKDPYTHYELGKCHRINGDGEAAIKELNKARELGLRDDYVLDQLALAHVVIGDFSFAESIYKKIPDHRRQGFMLKNLGNVYLLQGRTTEAVDTLKIAAAKDSTNHNTYYLLGKALLESGNTKEAKKALIRAVDLMRRKWGKDFPEAEKCLQQIPDEIPVTASESRVLDLKDEFRKAEDSGVIIYYNADRGFGFIKSPCHERVFFHVSQVVKGWQITKGARVNFRVEESDKGPKATCVNIERTLVEPRGVSG